MCIFTPKKIFLPTAFPIYMLSLASSIALIADSGAISSVFTPLVSVMTIFAGVFGLLGLLPILLATIGYSAFLYITGDLTPLAIAVISGGLLLPLIISFVMWRRQSNPSDNSLTGDDTRSYRNLASELSEVASKSEVVINAIGDGVIAIDNNGIIQLINPAAQIAIGWSKQDALTLNYKSVIHLVNMQGDAIEGANDPISQAINTNTEVRTSNLTLMTKSGKKVMISLVASPVSATASGVIVVFRDITKEKAEEREQAEFISTASHEMRTPVASIEGYMGLALNPQTAQIDDRARDFILKAHAAAEHLGRLFQDLLDVSKADDGRISNNPIIVDVVSFVQDILQGLTPKATEKGLKINYIPDTSHGNERTITPAYLVNLDRDHIREVVDNLVENAIKYTPKGTVTVNVTGDDDHVTISIQDSGIGIPAEDMPHLFQKFYRVASKDTNEIGGTGLGLYLSRRLVEIMGGRIWAESVLKSGSTFYVQLPRMDSQQAANIADQQQLQPPKQQIAEQPVIAPEPAPVAVKPAKQVPRGEALTPEQIATYVAQQRALAQEQGVKPVASQPVANQPDARPTSIKIPARVEVK
ncbi:MAG: ATP-binding protein [Candidatus Saccharibacteria bacterium]